MRRLAIALALLGAGCFGVDEPVCSFACGPMNECPDDYQCMPDGYCHLHGNNDPCGFSDASVPDLELPGDLGHVDLAMGDGPPGAVDLSVLDLSLLDAPASAHDLSQLDGPPPGQDSGPTQDLRQVDLAHADLSCVAANCPSMANACVANVITAFPAACDVSGACTYPASAVTTCPNGCFAAACVGSPFSSVGSTSAARTVGGAGVTLDVTTSNGTSTAGGPVPTGTSVTVTTITMPGGTAQTVTLIWSTDATMAPANQNPVTMNSTSVGAVSETWKGVIPAQGSATEIYFFIQAHPYSGADGFDPNGFGIHYAYAVN